MKKRWARVLNCVLAVLLVLSPFPASAAEQKSREEMPDDFVIVLDCSESLIINDPKNLRTAACKSFVDKLPAQNARVSVVAFGRKYEPYDPNNRLDEALVKEVVPLADLGDQQKKEEYKNIVEQVLPTRWSDERTYSPIGSAMMAGVQVLEKNKTPNGKACIILVSDGVHQPKLMQEDFPLLDEAARTAGEHRWPVYCIRLNYGDALDTKEKRDAMELMENLCKASGDKQMGPLNCSTPESIHVGFEKIFNDYYHLGKDPDNVVDEIQLPGEYEFEVPDLTSEANAVVFGEEVECVEIYRVEGDKEELQWTVRDDIEEKNLIAVVEKGSYCSIKILCPDAGKWKLKLQGSDKAKVLVSDTSLQEMGLKMVSVPSEKTEMLTKSGKVAVDAFFSYRDFEVHNTPFYGENPAKLVVYDSRGTVVREYTMTGNQAGYHFDLPLKEVPVGSFEVQVKLEHNMFRNGCKISNAEQYTLQNLALEPKNVKAAERTAFINSEFDPIDMSEVFVNPDGDKINYQVICTSDRTVKFDCAVDEDYLTIRSGLHAGEFAVDITAADPDMDKPLIYKAKLTVEDRALESDKIPNQELWVDKYFFQDDDHLMLDLNLGKYFTDPDGAPLNFTFQQKTPVASAELNDSMLHMEPQQEGESLVTVTASDGTTEQTREFTLKVVSGKAAYWKTHWIIYVVSIAVIAFIIILLIVIFKNKRVKGIWNITMDENGLYSEIEQIDIGAHIRCGRKPKFLLKDLAAELVPYMGEELENLKMSLNTYFTGNGADRIEIGGVYGRKGMVIRKGFKAGDKVRITCSHQPISKRTKITSGTVDFRLTNENEDVLTITMRLR